VARRLVLAPDVDALIDQLAQDAWGFAR
jgi:hypothetical protein